MRIPNIRNITPQRSETMNDSDDTIPTTIEVEGRTRNLAVGALSPSPKPDKPDLIQPSAITHAMGARLTVRALGVRAEIRAEKLRGQILHREEGVVFSLRRIWFCVTIQVDWAQLRRDCSAILRRPMLLIQADAGSAGSAGRGQRGSARVARPGDLGEWIRDAESDLAVARAQIPGALNKVYCFHAQQAMEKALKAVFVARGIPFQCIHKLRDLIAELAEHGLDIPDELRDVDTLGSITDYAVKKRYPPNLPGISDAERRLAVNIAARTVQWAEAEVARMKTPR